MTDRQPVRDVEPPDADDAAEQALKVAVIAFVLGVGNLFSLVLLFLVMVLT